MPPAATAPDPSAPSRGAGPALGLARALGVAGLGLGLAELLAPDEMAREVGLDRQQGARRALQAAGARELATAPGLVLGSAPAGWLWARLAGDAMDLAVLGRALARERRERRRRLAVATAAVAGIAALDLLAAARRPTRSAPLHLTAAVTVARPPEEVHRVWRDLERLPEFMTHLESVTTTGDGRSRWTARSPLGGDVSWDAELTDDVPGRRIAWRSVGRTSVPNSGAVRFTPAPGGRGTEVRVDLHYVVPAGRAGAAVARLLGEDPHQQVEDDLRRFKQVVETGEVIRSGGSPEGTSAPRQRVQRPAQPVGDR